MDNDSNVVLLFASNFTRAKEQKHNSVSSITTNNNDNVLAAAASKKTKTIHNKTNKNLYSHFRRPKKKHKTKDRKNLVVGMHFAYIAKMSMRVKRLQVCSIPIINHLTEAQS